MNGELSENNAGENPRIKSIDGLRGICALIVVMNHLMVGFFPVAYFGAGHIHLPNNIEFSLAQSPLSFWYAGNFMVCVFCSISSYVITAQFYKNQLSVIKMATSRYFRLVIPILFTSLIAYLFMRFKLFCNVSVAEITGSGWLYSLYNFQPELKDLIRGSLYDVVYLWYDKYNTVFWMIPLLFKGTFLTIFIIVIWGKQKKRLLIYVLLILLSFKQSKYYELSFIYGVICADFHENITLTNKKCKEIVALFLVIIGIYLGGYPTGIVPSNIWYTYLNIGEESFKIWHTLGAFFIILGIDTSKVAEKILSHKMFLWFGKISFSIFLVHILIICSFSCGIFNIMYYYTSHYLLSFTITMCSSWVVIILVSFLYNITIEKYSNVLQKGLLTFY